MNTKIIIYETAMCCSSGVCGPNPDKSLITLQDALDKLKHMGAKVERYSITGSPKKFRENPEIIKIMQERQIKALPITTCDGKVVKIGSYPSIDEFKKYIENGDIELAASAEGSTAGQACCSGQETTGNEDCCSTANSCDINCGPNYRSNNSINTTGKCC